MHPRTALLLCLSITSLGALGVGCQAGRGDGVVPGLGEAERDGLPRSSSNLGMFEVSVDLQTLAARVEVAGDYKRGGQMSELYNLEINDFLTWESFRVTGVSLTDDSLLLTYVLTHPFKAASNLAGPSTAANREDLAITGRVVWLADDPDAETYFAGDGDVRVNTRMVRNPDGYWSPGGLIASPGGTANTYPYQLMVDEARDNRVGLSNEGVARGNYGGSGWQVAEFTDGITGFDVLAQGQASTNTLQIARSEIGGGSTFDVVAALIAKYEDPRGGVDGDERRTNRLPRTDNDVLKFTYRMPHGALDLGRVSVIPPRALIEGEFGSVYSAVHLRDWDARAVEASQTNLAGETNSSLVSAGESGVPTVEIDIPLMTGFSGDPLQITDDDSGAGGDVDVDSGVAMDELYFVGTASGTPVGTGAITGLVRATDVVDITPPADWLANRIDLGPGLTPLGTGHEGATYQSFTIELLPSTAGAFAWAKSWGGIGNEYGSAVTVTDDGYSFIAGSYDNTMDLDPGPGEWLVTPEAGLDVFIVGLDPDGDLSTGAVFPSDLAAYVTGIVVDADRDVYFTGSFYGTMAFDPDGGMQRTSVGDRDIYVCSLDLDLEQGWVATMGSTGSDEGRGIVVDELGNTYTTGTFAGTVDFDAGAGTADRSSAGLADGFVLALAPDGSFRWADPMGGTRFDYGNGIDQDADGNLYIAGTYEDSADLNPGAGVANHTAAGSYDSYLIALESAGGYRWSKAWGGGPSDEAYDVAVSAGGFSYITGYFGGAADFDPGPLAVTRTGLGFNDGYVLALTPGGAFRWVSTITGTSLEAPAGIALDDFGRLYLTGYFAGTTDFCPGPVSVTREAVGFADCFVLSLAANNGSYRWVGTVGSAPNDDQGAAIAVTPQGRSHTVGYFYDVADFDPGPAVDNRTSAGVRDAYMLTLEP